MDISSMNYFDAGGGVLITAACKSGSTSCRTVFPTWDKPVIDEELSEIYLVIRNPRVRLLSAWRQFYEAPSRRWVEQKKTLDHIAHEKYIRKHAQNILKRPVKYFEDFCANTLPDYLDDAHFTPQWREYRHLYLFHGEKIRLWNHYNLDSLFEKFHVPVVRNHVQKWQWPHLSINNFFKHPAAKRADRYYLEDAILWHRVDK